MASKRPAVGIGVLVVRDGKLLFGKRKTSHGIGCWAPAGGHLEFGESFEECARREVFEETGLVVSDIVQGPTVNDVFTDVDKHYVTIFMIAHSVHGEPRTCEPDKCEGWQWFVPEELPTPLFLTVESLLKQGFNLSSYLSALGKHQETRYRFDDSTP